MKAKQKAPQEWQNRIVGYETHPASWFRANPQNWRIHPKAQQDALGGVLDSVGVVQNVLVNQRTGNMIDGHLRVTLALRRGDETPLPVTVVDLSEEEEATILATLDPLAAMAATDKAKLDELMRAVQSDDARVQAMLAEMAEREGLEYGREEPKDDPGAQIDRAEELREKWGTEPGQLWQIGRHRLICGDCTDRAIVERVMGGDRANLVFSDPPYNVAYSGRGQNTDKTIENDDMPDGEFTEWLNKVCQSFDACMSDGACVYLCHGDTGRHMLPFVECFDVIGWTRSATIIWAKNAASMGWQDYRSQHECLSYGWKSGAKHYFVDDRSQTTLWEIARDSQNKYVHPTTKPVELAERAIRNSSRKDDIIIDFFLGSGTTLVACEQTGRIGRACEISPAYVAVALERLSQMGLTPELIDTMDA